MKRKMVFALFLMLGTLVVKAQDCEAIMLPYFKGDMQRLVEYRDNAPHKYMFRCVYAQSAFYESDTVPAGADLFPISEVKDKFTGVSLPNNYRVDLATLSYYRYTFYDFQHQYPTGDKVLCFSTPGSTHPYLVLRSISDMHRETSDRLLAVESNN